MRIHIHFLLTCLCILPLLTCCTGQNRLESALLQSGDNRDRLENALLSVAGDSLKSKAMELSIINSQYYHERTGRDLDSLKRALKGPKLSDAERKAWQRKDVSSIRMSADVSRISDTILVDNVNLAVDVWRSRPWSRHYSDDDFFQYVLPYRIADEPLENWRGAYLERYAAVYDSLCNGVDDPVEAAMLILTHVRNSKVATLPEMSYPHLGALHLLDSRRGYCRDHCDIAIYVLRSLGIPVATDFYESSPSYNSRHFWTAVVDTLHRVREFNLGERPYTWEKPERRKKGKVYREKFSPQEPMSGEDICPFFRNPFIEDVSDEYGFSSDISLEITGNDSCHQYLSFYDGREYQPIAITKVRDGKTTFVNIEEGLIYFPTYYNPGTKSMRPSSYPVLSGKTQHDFIPDMSNQDSVRIWRKYPMQKTKVFLGNAVGMKIEGYVKNGVDKSFSIELTDTPSINIIRLQLPDRSAFRFLSLCAPCNKRLELSEIIAMTADGSVKPVSVINATTGTEITQTILPIITDDRWETCYVSKKDGEHIVLDFGHVIKTDELTIIPRTDDNFVHPGDEYELFYHAGAEGWKSLGRKKADGSSLDYAAPRNAVLWLKNYTRGKEERPFYMQENSQIFP